MESKLPKNWVETELGEILKLKNGYAFKTKDYREEGIPLIRIGNIQQGNVSTKKSICVDKNDSAENFIIKKGDVLVAMSGATTGKYGVFNEDIKVYQNQRVGNLKPLAPDLTSTNFIYYLLGGLQKEIEDKAYGGAQPNISAKLIETIKIGFPPLAEQQRIVAKLDTLFGSLDALKIRLNNIPQLIKNFKQAVLTQAVTGKLTQEWRVGKELEEWEETELINLILQKPRNGYSPPGVNYITEVKSLSLSATTSGKFNASKVKYLDIEKPKNDSHLWLKKGDILIQRSNSLDYVGTSAIYDGEDDDFIYPDIMMKIQVNEKIDNSYMNYVLSSSKIRTYYKDNATGTAGNMPKINQVVVSNTPICYPPKEEQTEIVKRVENLFSKADAIEKQYKTLKEKIDRLPQAILAKAFKGELVAQLPTDGDAKDLLEEIKKLKESLVVKPKKKVVRNKK
ncbi:restriction endonuclease subunit S [Tenacibaculum finnmarkense]|uniref:restriction endonuclease subunit S n=1 Tax=Tenacibaculum finnmarkense TaxID=2781243 RepID=UPI001EFAC1D7|nr:restriction endonuclease subunit S [Tenacibaculum finnmarkense]MCG8225659.1 restriction endonuclease subunit S [Tenacibaculum finnmarkense genomovar finnmarkense]MCG8715797.1 type I restriction endonuclease subunit S [Tenacibaculum finnmarkense]MCG8767962.1 type I restriction endonuclease subunit S [Tenacibaculum finnmarkense]MCG8823603.1 type I restriction endonuclease subunit S [Tenacibaculum finnmarkense]